MSTTVATAKSINEAPVRKVINIRATRRRELAEISRETPGVGRLKLYVIIGIAALGFSMLRFLGVI